MNSHKELNSTNIFTASKNDESGQNKILMKSDNVHAAFWNREATKPIFKTLIDRAYDLPLINLNGNCKTLYDASCLGRGIAKIAEGSNVVTWVRIFTDPKLSKKKIALIERSIANIAKHLTDAAEYVNYPAHRKYHFKLACEAFEACPVEYALTEQAWSVVDYDSFCNFMEDVGDTTNSLRLVTRSDRQLLANLLTDAINLSFRWIKPTKANMELIIDLHSTRMANANTVPFAPVEEAA